MSKRTVWSHFLGGSGPVRYVIEALAKVGLSTRSPVLPGPAGSGILFFSQTDPSLFSFVREVSSSGFERVLTVALPPARLPAADRWRLLQAGASDVLVWGDSARPTEEIAARFDRWSAVDELVESPLVRENLVGRTKTWTVMLRQLVEVARFTDASIHITGESGTGKELAARLIHSLDPRPDKRDLVVLDCTTIVPDLSGSEFFGHERGAFTGAAGARDGAFALANGGTLFLDEVGELPLGLQAQLLRVVQEHTYKRVGGNTWHDTTFRLVCATNRNLREEVARGGFRADLYYRIAAWTCKLPPLRERTEDIVDLVQHFLRKLRPNEDPPPLDEAVREYLMQREYAGNIRELKQAVARMSYRHVGPGPFTVGDIPEEDRPAIEPLPATWHESQLESAIRRALSLGIDLKEISREAAATAIRIAVADEGGNLQRAARRLGVTDRALQMRRAVRREMHPPRSKTESATG